MTDHTAADVQFGRQFVLVRNGAVIADGIEFPDGHVAIHWTGAAYPTLTPHQTMDAAIAAHSQNGAVRVVWQLTGIPQAEYGSVWPELTGWVQQAQEDGEQIDPAQLLEYMRELKQRALAPVREWMDSARGAAAPASGPHRPPCVDGDHCGEAAHCPPTMSATEAAARQAAGQQKPTMAYGNGKGRVYCLNCASAVGADVALTVDVVDHWELCPSCGQHVVDVARQAAGQPAAECACGHAAHAPGDECEDSVQHGPKRWHRCLCLNRAGANMACPPDMDCQGGTLGYSDIWHKQRGYTPLVFVQSDPTTADDLIPPAAGLAAPTNHDTETEALVHVGWWCWRGDNHGHLTTQACRSDNVPLHVPTEWADDMRAVIGRIEDGEDDAAGAES